MKSLVTLFFFLGSVWCFAQKQASIWYFGENAGLDFSSGHPQAIFNSAMITWETCAAISDANGNLLFYTNGIDIWDRSHKVMPNGHNLGVVTLAQYAQALIVPQPGNKSVYYVFTTSRYVYDVPDSMRFNYSIVDMQLGGGMGDVVKKNIPLFKKSTEKMTAVHHANGRDVWLVAHEWQSNVFRSYLVTENGIDTANYATSPSGAVHEGGIQNANSVGQMKLSPDGKKIAVAINQLGMQLFDFDNTSGVVSNPSSLIFDGVNCNIAAYIYYGIEFSPNSRFVYYNVLTGSCIGLTHYLKRYDTQTKVFSVLDNADCSYFSGGLQLAID